MPTTRMWIGFTLWGVFGASLAVSQEKKAGDEALGTRKYEEYEKPDFCGTSCHVDFYQQWTTGDDVAGLHPPLG